VRHIADTATRLFVERGFDRVTIAEVADAAEVSVNTVYNHFRSKEDLVLPPEEASPRRLAAIVRERPVGCSAAAAVLDRLRAEVRGRERAVGLTEGFAPVLRMMTAAPTLAARLHDLGDLMVAELAADLAAETGAAPDDPLPRLVAGQIGWMHALVFGEIGARVAAGERPRDVAAAVLALIDAAESVLSERVLGYAVRNDQKGGPA
jgi:AcrR family transcriptional regulator